MSWWNASNFTDLASKALKTAQKKIDSALDINEDGTAKHDTTGASVQKESTSKTDFWGTLGGGSTTDDNTGAASGWSFPWGASTGDAVQESTSESLIKVKSAEEIKSEVLKAAKERTKAKAKLFPQKAKTVSEHEKAVQESLTAVTDKNINYGVKLKSEKPPDTGVDTVSKDLKPKVCLTDSPILKEIEPSEIEFSTQQTRKNERTESNIQVTTDDTSSEKETEIVAKLDLSELEEKVPIDVSFTTDSLQKEDETNASDIKENDEQDVVTSDKEEFKINTDQFNETKVLSDDDNRAEATEVIEQELNIERELMPIMKETDESDVVKRGHAILPEGSDKTQKNVTQFIGVDDGTDNNGTSDSDLTRELSGADISSSVEFVTVRDIPAVENLTVSESVDFCEQLSSDPEIIDCDKTNSDEEFVNDKFSTDSFLDEKSGNEEQSVILGDYCNEDVKEAGMTVADTSQEVAKAEPKFSQEKVYHEVVVVETEEIAEAGNQLEQGVKPEEYTNVSGDESLLMVMPDSFVSEAVKPLRSSDSESSVNKLDSSMETCTSEDTVVEQGSNLDDSNDRSGLAIKIQEVNVEQNVCLQSEQKEEETSDAMAESSAEKLDIKTDSEENDTEKGTISPAHSFVKCMLEDALEEGKHGDDNSDSHSSIEKSEGTRSVYSNQESSDEIDTTTSSDIEIISLPTPNGENRQVSPLDPIPLRIALQKTSWRGSPTHRRTDSSDSSNASGGNYELSPGRECTDYADYHKSHSEHPDYHTHSLVPELPALDEEDDNPYHPQRLLKDETNMTESHDMRSEGQMSPDPTLKSCDHDQMSHDPETLKQKLADMAEVLQAREEKLLTLSKENCDLVETNSIIKNQLKQSEEAREAEMTDVNELTAEFTQRLTESEKRISSAIQEKEVIKKQLQDSQTELARRAGDVNLKEILAEKEEQIAGLLQEGEKLSKSQLQSNTIIKKLRQKEKDNESTITSQKKKIETQTTELEHLRKVLDSKEDLEKKQTEAIAQLSSAVKKQEQEMEKLKSEHEDAVEKARGLQVALDNSYKEMAELHRNNAAQNSKAHEAALSAETHVREELKMALEKQQQQHKWNIDSLNMQIDDHRLSMARMEKEYNRREDLLKQEISDLQKQLQEDELRTQELTQGVSQATRPLLRQIENLQSTYNAQSSTWEKVERNMSERLAETQNQLAVAMEKERTANEQVIELGSKVTSLETQTSRLKQERSQMTAQLEMLKTKVELSEDAKQNEAAQIELMKQQMAQEMQELKKQKVLLETQLDVEKSKLEQERKKTAMLQEKMRDMERDLTRSTSRSRGTPVRGTPSPVSVSRQDSMVGSIHESTFTAITQEELDRSFVLSSPNGNKQSLYETLRQSGAANLLENLQSQLKLREGEISHLQSEIKTLERTRESMARELVDLCNKNDSLEEKVKDVPLLEEQYRDLDQRYNALLQMYGEKSEEAEELRLDLQDIKDMYKAQINQLLGQS